MVKVLLDTDIGTDIDDALCLAYLLSHNECDLLGITTVSGETEKRAMLASAMCHQAGKDIPIYPGIEQPLLGKQLQAFAKQYDKISRWEHNQSFPQHQAIEFMRKTIRDNPGEITLLAIGPLTNIAILFSIDREVPKLLKELVIMCGEFQSPINEDSIAEWNVMCDPYAAEIVFKAQVKKVRCVGLDVTMKLTMDKNEMLEKCRANILKPMVDFAEVWFEKSDKMTFHDPLAAAVIFDDSICEFEYGTANVELKNDKIIGCTHWNNNSENNKHMSASKVDTNGFFKHYFKIVNQY